MKSRLYIKHLSLTAIILVQLILSSSILMGQEKVNLDSLFFKARDYYRQQKYDSVRLLSNEILLIDENYYDARVLLGRTMAHAQELDSAATEYTSRLLGCCRWDDWPGNEPGQPRHCIIF